MSIKTPDLCERCVYSVEHCKALEVCKGCPMCSMETGRCKCLTIKPNTPCPYFEEAENDERATEAWNSDVVRFGVTPYDGWISVDDRLPIEEAKAHEQEWPEEYPEFLVMIERGSLPTTLYYDWEENEWFRINTALERETYEVTHWMPLPPPPKGE